MFTEVRPAPLIIRRSSLDRRTVERKLRIEPDSQRTVVFLGARGRISASALGAAATAASDFLFLVLDAAAACGPENIRHIVLDDNLNFSDVLLASDVVISKLGYGIVAECAAGKKRLLYPRREAFREDLITSAEAPRYTNIREIPLENFETGAWTGHLHELLKEPQPALEIPSNGAVVCAEELSRRLS